MVLVDVPKWCNRMDRLKELIINGIKKKMRNVILMRGLKYIRNIDKKYNDLYNILLEVLRDNDGITVHFPPDMVASDKYLQNIMKSYEETVDGMDPNKIITKIDRLYDNEMINPTKLRMVGLIIEDVPLQYLKNIKIPIGTEYALLQDSSVLSDVIKFLVDIPQCTHCWAIGHKWKWCKERNKEIREKRNNADKLYNENKMQKKERNKIWNEPPKRYCKKCHNRGHNGKDCYSKVKKCGICLGPHESIKCAQCPVIKKLITLYQKATIMRDDGALIENIRKMDNFNIMKYDSGGNALHQQKLSQSMTASTVDRGGTDNMDENKNEENNNDLNDNELSLQINHNNSANNSLNPTTSSKVSQASISASDKGILKDVQINNNNEFNSHYDDSQVNDDERAVFADTLGGTEPPSKKRKTVNTV